MYFIAIRQITDNNYWKLTKTLDLKIRWTGNWTICIIYLLCRVKTILLLTEIDILCNFIVAFILSLIA